MWRRAPAVILALLVAGVSLASCGSGSVNGPNAPLAPYNALACASMNDEFLGMYKTPADQHREALDAESYTALPENPAIRAAAVALKNDANASNQAAVTSDVVAFELACHNLRIGGGDVG